MLEMNREDRVHLTKKENLSRREKMKYSVTLPKIRRKGKELFLGGCAPADPK